MTADPIPSLREFRLSLGLNLETVAGHLGTDVARMRAIEDAQARPTAAEVARLCELFAITADDVDRAMAATRMARKRGERRPGNRMEIVERAIK